MKTQIGVTIWRHQAYTELMVNCGRIIGSWCINQTAVECRAWLINYIPLFYVSIITQNFVDYNRHFSSQYDSVLNVFHSILLAINVREALCSVQIQAYKNNLPERFLQLCFARTTITKQNRRWPHFRLALVTGSPTRRIQRWNLLIWRWWYPRWWYRPCE